MREEIGSRLKAERERLGYNQADFAAIGEASKRSQIDWEQGKLVPNAEFLALVAGVGVDTQFVLTGVVSSNTMTDDENELLAAYRALDIKGKARLFGVVEGIQAPEPARRKQSITIHGDIGQQVAGDIMAPTTIKLGRKKK